jgi:alpha-ketoglutarate-dependent taurine dioxygenase
MKPSDFSEINPKKLGTVRRKMVTVSPEDLVQTTFLQSNVSLPLVIEPKIQDLDLIDWAKNNRSFIEKFLYKHGGILFRNFKIDDVEKFEQFIKVTSNSELLPYQDGSSPRTLVKGNIYTSTDYPASQRISLHSELSYASTYPLKIYFYCVKPAEKGGETPIADIRKVCDRISLPTRDRFRQKQIMYVRNFGNKLGLSWQKAFETLNIKTVENYCQENDIQVKWKIDGNLQTNQVRPAIVNHPKTGEMVWFNHAAFFHISTLEPKIRQTLLAEFTEAELPYNTYYGDRSAIKPEVIEEIRMAYCQETVTFSWQTGDILMLDNMLTAHGRNPFIGSRQVVVGMAESFIRKTLSQIDN